MLRPIMFTPTEAAVVTLLFDGKGVDEIAAARGVVQSSVRSTLHLVYHKAGVNSSLALIALAFKQGGFLW